MTEFLTFSPLAENLTTEKIESALPFIDHLPYPVLWIDLNYHVQYANTSAQTVYGISKHTCYELTHGYKHPCHLQGEPCPKVEALQNQRPVSVTHSHVTENGSQLFMVLALPVDNGDVLEFHIELTDTISRDALTQTLARPFFEQLVRRELALIERMELPYGMIFIDLDHFKQINDNHGHKAGDMALRAIGNTITGLLRKSDLAGRWGGEEFCIFLPSSDADHSMQVATRLRDAIRGIHLHKPWTHVHTTASLGVFSSNEHYDFDHAVRGADLAMYHAKSKGKDRVELAESGVSLHTHQPHT